MVPAATEPGAAAPSPTAAETGAALSFQFLKPRLADIEKNELASMAVTLFEILVEAAFGSSSENVQVEEKISQLRRDLELHPESLASLASQISKEPRQHDPPSAGTENVARLKKALSDLDSMISSASGASRQALRYVAAISQEANAAGDRPEAAGKARTITSVTRTSGRPALKTPEPQVPSSQPEAGSPRSAIYDNDPLTGLPGRASAEEALERMAHAAEPSHVAVFMLDRLKIINERYGFRAGDQVLLFFGQRLTQQLTARSSVYRWSPAAFLVIFDEPLSRQQIFEQVRDVALTKLLKSFHVQNRTVLVQITTQWKLIAAGNGPAEALSQEIDQFVSTPQQVRGGQE